MLVSGTAAEVPLKSVPDLFFAGIRISLQNLRRRHDHSRRAVATLQAMMLPEAFLHRMQLALGCQPFDGGDLRTIGLDGKQGAGLDRLSIDQHGTRAAKRGLTAD